MAEYIDRERQIEMVRRALNADLVEVVRCKDCKYCASVSDPIIDAVLVFCEYGLKPTAIEPTHFCSYGERKE